MKPVSRWVAPVVAVVLAGCAHTAKESTQSSNEPPAVAKEDTTKESAATTQAQHCNSDDDCALNALCIRNQCVPISAGLAECSTVRVHFDFNGSDIKDNDKPPLTRISRCLRAEHALKVTIEGNADERGTEEYNLALGQKRASVVARYLEALGVGANQLKTISYGYEKPVCEEHNEECWAKNRRAAVKPH